MSLQWGIIGAGSIAGAFADGLKTSTTGKLVAVGSRDEAKAQKFASRYEGVTAHGSYEALLADNNVQAVYIATPHPQHGEWVIKSAEAGKHILCEKPLGVNFAQAMTMVQAAKDHGVFFMEAFMYRCHPQTARLVELIKSKAIGEVRIIQASFAFNAGFNPNSRLFNNDLAGGGILDVGTYCTSMSILIAGAAQGQDFLEPTEVKAVGHPCETGVDGYTVAVAKFPGNIVAQLATGVQVGMDNALRIFGSEGWIVVDQPWLATGRQGGKCKIVVKRKGQKDAEEIWIEEPKSIYGVEADTVAAHIENKQAPSPAMTWEDTLANMRFLDSWRSAIGLTYEQERVARLMPLANRPLHFNKKPRIPHGKIAGIDKPVARLAVGADYAGGNPRDAYAVYDEYFEFGGNVFDTSFPYGGGASDLALGQWVHSRGAVKEAVIICKGAHTPHCNPVAFKSQFDQSMERFRLDQVDTYIWHRDNLDIPVGELVDATNREIAKGRIRVWGGSNWTLARFDEAIAYAKKNNLQPPTLLSNNFSLARMVDPVWGGCIAASDPESRAWLTKTQVNLIPWSSQARGFFTPRADPSPQEQTDKELLRCWYSDDNFERRKRAYEMAAKRKCDPICIALAYVLTQPFPTFPLIGPRRISELRSSMGALDVTLTPDEVKWLNLET
ncbi:MAG: oxidoreductase [Phycisphaera sp.]|nr:oxidoreductase [Phycisphaera sp.]